MSTSTSREERRYEEVAPCEVVGVSLEIACVCDYNEVDISQCLL